MTVWKWDKSVADNNASADSTINWAEGQAPSTVNNSARAMMTAVAKWRDDIGGTLNTAGGPTAYTIATTNQGFAGSASPPANGTTLSFLLNQANAVSATLSIDGGTAYPLQTSAGTAVTAGLLRANTVYTATFRTGTFGWVLNNIYTQTIAADTITTAMLQADSVTYAKIQNVTNGRLLGNFSGILSDVSEYALGAFLSVSATALNLATDIVNKGKIIGYDFSTGAPTTFTLGGPLLHIREQLATSTTGGGTFTAGAYRQRPLSTVITNEITGAALASNQITGLPAGTYMCTGYTSASIGSAAGATGLMRARLRDMTGSATLLLGSSEASFVVNPQSSNVNLASRFYGRFTLAAPSTVEVQGWFVGCTGGVAVNSGDSEVYTDLLIWRLA